MLTELSSARQVVVLLLSMCQWLVLRSIRTDAEILRRQNMLQTLVGRRDELERQERNHTASAVNQRYVFDDRLTCGEGTR